MHYRMSLYNLEEITKTSCAERCQDLQLAITQALLVSLATAGAVHTRCPQVHTPHIAVDVQEQNSFNIIWEGQRLAITNHLPGQTTPKSRLCQHVSMLDGPPQAQN